jgi:hypothetical protein
MLSRSPLPSDHHISDLLEKLDQITTTRFIPSETDLLDNEEAELLIKQDSIHYLRIFSLNKKNPLTVSLKKSFGKVLVYSSFTHPKPSYSKCDKTFSSETFEIRTLDTQFKNDFVFLALRALTCSKILASVSFGRKNVIHPVLLKKDKKKQQELSEDRLRELKMMKKKHFPKNFLIENLNKRMLSPEELAGKNKNWLVKREKAILKKKKNIEQKKKKALEFVNKREIQRLQAKAEEEKMEIKENFEGFLKSLLKIIMILKVSFVFNEFRRRRRSEVSRKIVKNQKARTIQRFFRENTGGLNKKDIVLTICQQNLVLFSNLAFFTRKESKKIVFRCIQETGTCLKPSSKVSAFFQKLVLIQQRFRRYLEVKAERIRKLILFWDECRSFQKRRTAKKKTLVHEISISISQREEILQRYYLDCVRKFYDVVRCEGIFISDVLNRHVKRFIRFEFMPSTIVMKQLIESL